MWTPMLLKILGGGYQVGRIFGYIQQPARQNAAIRYPGVRTAEIEVNGLYGGCGGDLSHAVNRPGEGV
jgi:hypothetical protein